MVYYFIYKLVYQCSHRKMKKSVSKSDMVYKTLYKKITDGVFFPGERLMENALVKELGVSKTPVREALVKLVQDGLAERSTGQGVRVARVSSQDAEEIYDLREYLEGLAAKKAAGKITPDKSEKLSSFIRRFEKLIKKNDVREYARLDMEFHNLLADLSESPRVSKIMRRIYTQARLLLKTSLRLPGRGPEVSLTEHKRLVEAIVKGNPPLAERRAREHVEETRRAVMDWFRRLG